MFETQQPIYELKINGSTPKSPEVQRAWLESVRPLRSRDGALRHILVSVQEITALERAEAALRESERILRASHQLSPDGFTILRAIRDDDGECIDFAWEYANSAVEEVLNMGPLIGKRLLEVPPETVTILICSLGTSGCCRCADQTKQSCTTRPTVFRLGSGIVLSRSIAIGSLCRFRIYREGRTPSSSWRW
ncbi:hypothetical protein ABIG06_000483 [Bradyrhizobium sp. USDA 326]